MPGCKRIFKNKSGRTKHMRMLHPRPLRNHRTFHQAAPAPPHSPSPERHNEDDALHLDENGPGDGFMPDPDIENGPGDGFMPDPDTCVQLGPLFRTFHPHLTGKFLYYMLIQI
jgi:hypothetical protein